MANSNKRAMYIAHSQIFHEPTATRPKKKPRASSFGEQYSHDFFVKACAKHAAKIAEVQRLLPGWMPTDPNK